MDWQLTTLNEGMRVLFWGLVRTPEDKRDMAAIKKAAKDTGELWRRADARLAKNKYLGGARFTMGDIPAGCFVQRWFALPIERPDLPHLKAWHERLATRPAFAKHIMIKMT
jgi:glutathione S-transferase